MDQPRLKLFVMGGTHRAAAAVRALEAVRRQLADGWHIDVIDVMQRPELAEEQNIIATPTLLRESPGPPRRIVGDLSDVRRVSEFLSI